MRINLDYGINFEICILDKMHLIDWETDSDKEEANNPEDIESAVEISDCVSCASSPLTCEDRLSEFPKVRVKFIFSCAYAVIRSR